MIYLIVGPFGVFLFFRVLLPSIWCLDFLISNYFSHKYYEIVFVHMVYLLLEGFLTISLMVYIVNSVVKFRRYYGSQVCIDKKEKEGKKYALIAIVGIFLFFILNFNSLPIFMSGGSDAIVSLGEMQKTKTWFMYGILGLFVIVLLFSIIYIKSTTKKYLYGVILVLASLITGKKAALISLLNKFVFVYFITSSRPKLPFLKIGIFIIISVFFILIQFSRTHGHEITIYNMLGILFNLIYYSSTNYLDWMFTLDGISHIELYSETLGFMGWVKYTLNPFLKFLFGIGVEQAIGPFLNYQFYGFEFPNGPQPTLFFEYMFVWGTEFAFIGAFLNMVLIFLLSRVIFEKLLYYINKSMLVTVTLFLSFLACFSLLLDTPLTVRTLPFILLPLVIHLLHGLLVKLSKKRVN